MQLFETVFVMCEFCEVNLEIAVIFVSSYTHDVNQMKVMSFYLMYRLMYFYLISFDCIYYLIKVYCKKKHPFVFGPFDRRCRGE